MKKLLLIALAGATLAACGDKGGEHHGHKVGKAELDSMRNELLNVDIAFSKMSEEKGRSVAFTEYAADNATLLRPLSRPVTGRQAIADLLKNYPDSLYKLTWVPISSDVARSGEIGFTYGTYHLEIKGGDHEEGTYNVVWHKDSTHAWKYILETSNAGLSKGDKAEDEKVDAELEKDKK
jgi:ketosteroid isomerase-like protein